MTQRDLFLSAEHVAAATNRLARFSVALRYERLPTHVRERLELTLTDLFGVTLAGLSTPEMRALADVWTRPGDQHRPAAGTTVDGAAYLAAVASCVLELDEGNKYASGHPAAHVVFAAIAAARGSGRPISGERFLTAVAAGYEVAARFGAATDRDPRWHTHGHWGATGAACAATFLLDGDADQVAAAIDSATGLMHVTPWQTVLAGDFTRNLWAAGANRAGLDASRLALARLVRNRGSAAYSLGDLVGSLDPDVLLTGLGDHWLTAAGYLKRHASCSYTHAAVDLVQTLREAGAWRRTAEVASVCVRTHSLAAPLSRRHPDSRLAAMFSLPFVVATAVVHGRVDPDTMQPGTIAFAAAEEFSERVDVTVDRRLDDFLPDRRCCEVEVHLHDGSRVALAQPNPVGDVAHFPLGREHVAHKLRLLIGDSAAEQVARVVAALPGSRCVRSLLDALPSPLGHDARVAESERCSAPHA